MHGRTWSAWPARVFFTMSGSAMCARVIPTRSASPARITWSASSIVRKRPVTMRATFTRAVTGALVTIS